MTQAKILVTSATGRIGLAAAKTLLAKGFPVRAFVRRRNSQAQALEAAGAELFIGDIYDYRDVLKALDGVQRAFYCPPFGPNLLHGATVFATAGSKEKCAACEKLGAKLAVNYRCRSDSAGAAVHEKTFAWL